MEKFKKGFCVNGKNPIETVEWYFSKEYSNDSKLVFFAYDANLYALPDFSTWLNKDLKQKQIEKALEVCKDFNGSVYLDDVKIK